MNLAARWSLLTWPLPSIQSLTRADEALIHARVLPPSTPVS
jgi:hypothetical protein